MKRRHERRRLRGGRAVCGWMIALALWARCDPAWASERLIVLDPGHTLRHPGAISVRGTTEVGYNDALVALLRERLTARRFRVEVTRGADEERSLDERAALANAHGAWLFLAIHHDSAQLRYLEQRGRGGKTSYRTTRPIRGYSLFVSGLNPRYEESLRAAEALGRRLLALGRAPTLHHAELIPGEGRPLVPGQEKLGIYRFDDLRVLRQASCPAVLLEVGVVVDEIDEAYVSDPIHQEEIVEAIVHGIEDVAAP